MHSSSIDAGDGVARLHDGERVAALLLHHELAALVLAEPDRQLLGHVERVDVRRAAKVARQRDGGVLEAGIAHAVRRRKAEHLVAEQPQLVVGMARAVRVGRTPCEDEVPNLGRSRVISGSLG